MKLLVITSSYHVMLCVVIVGQVLYSKAGHVRSVRILIHAALDKTTG